MRKHSEATKKRISIALKGKAPDNYHLLNTPEANRKKSLAHKGRKRTEEHNRHNSEAHKGKKHSEETRRKIGDALKGDKNPLWNGGISAENSRIRAGIEWRLWREAIFARDNWTCQKYGIQKEEIHPHHIQNFTQYPELRFAIDNGITLSKRAHREFHKKYGTKNNTKEQIKEFLKVGK